MNTRFTVRAAKHDDIPAIQHVARTTWRATYVGQIADPDIEQFLSSAYSQRNLAIALGRLGNGFVVVSINGDVVGYTMAGLNRDGEPELSAIYVLPEHHGSGAGQMLWDSAKRVLARQGQSRMCCWVLATNERARRFYERQGAFLAEEREFQVGATSIREARYCIPLSGLG